jgi:hypothetical protein
MNHAGMHRSLVCPSDAASASLPYRLERKRLSDGEDLMPRFIDQHPTNPNMPPELVTLIKQRLRSGESDEFGEKRINVFIGSQRTYCYTEAPSAEAVRKSHEAMGITLAPNDVEEVQSLP